MAHRPVNTARDPALSQRAVVVAVDTRDPRRPLEPELAEFEALAAAAGAHVAERIVQQRESVDPATMVGSGKAREIAERAAQAGADLILVLNNLRPRQRKNLEAIVPLPIVDRTMLILDVFARHARSREGKLQVELAQLRYRQSNLIGAGADLSRLGGGIGTRGPGETKLEVDRRRIGQRIGLLNQRLASVRRQRAVRRAAPHREPLVALVGYTNAGKSSLLNALARSDAFVADQPFATLDPTVRRVFLGSDAHARLADTVGFITELPKDLIAAFRATLEELREANLLVHVVDAANPDWPRQRLAVESILRDLELSSTPALLVFNKADLLAAQAPREAGALYVSAARGAGLAQLRAALRARLQAQAIT
jgi:GTPase